MILPHNMGFPGGSGSKESACNAGDPGSIPGSENPLEKEIKNHANIPAWKIPRTEEPGGLHSLGSQRIGHGRVTNMHTYKPHIYVFHSAYIFLSSMLGLLFVFEFLKNMILDIIFTILLF